MHVPMTLKTANCNNMNHLTIADLEGGPTDYIFLNYRYFCISLLWQNMVLSPTQGTVPN